MIAVVNERNTEVCFPAFNDDHLERCIDGNPSNDREKQQNVNERKSFCNEMMLTSG